MFAAPNTASSGGMMQLFKLTRANPKMPPSAPPAIPPITLPQIKHLPVPPIDPRISPLRPPITPPPSPGMRCASQFKRVFSEV